MVRGVSRVNYEIPRLSKFARRCSKVFQIISASLVRVGDVQGVPRRHAVRIKTHWDSSMYYIIIYLFLYIYFFVFIFLFIIFVFFFNSVIFIVIIFYVNICDDGEVRLLSFCGQYIRTYIFVLPLVCCLLLLLIVDDV